jgi:hypothetical protein
VFRIGFIRNTVVFPQKKSVLRDHTGKEVGENLASCELGANCAWRSVRCLRMRHIRQQGERGSIARTDGESLGHHYVDDNNADIARSVGLDA